MSRIAPLVDELVGVESADDIMQEVLGVLSEGSSPETGNICLLYTSPSPRDLSTSRMPSSA